MRSVSVSVDQYKRSEWKFLLSSSSFRLSSQQSKAWYAHRVHQEHTHSASATWDLPRDRFRFANHREDFHRVALLKHQSPQPFCEQSSNSNFVWSTSGIKAEKFVLSEFAFIDSRQPHSWSKVSDAQRETWWLNSSTVSFSPSTCVSQSLPQCYQKSSAQFCSRFCSINSCGNFRRKCLPNAGFKLQLNTLSASSSSPNCAIFHFRGFHLWFREFH